MANASSNRVKLVSIPETAYGVTPSAGNFDTVNFTNESISGNVNTQESAIVRSDRNSQGQLISGIDVGGSIESELQDYNFLKTLIEAAMLSTFATVPEKTVSMTIAASPKTLTRSSGSFVTDGVKVGDVLKLSGYTKAVNNTYIIATDVTPTVITFASPKGDFAMEDEAGTASTKLKIVDKIGIGTTIKSFSMQRSFEDLTTKALIYRGLVCNSLTFNISNKDIITYSAEFMGNYFNDVNKATGFITTGRIQTPQPQSKLFDGSTDLKTIATKVGSWGQNQMIIEDITVTISNNYIPLNALGSRVPLSYNPGYAKVELAMSIALNDVAWPLLKYKITQDPISLAFVLDNTDEALGFYFPSLQLENNDPQSEGQSQNVMLNVNGVGSVGPGRTSAVTIFRNPKP